MSRPRTLARLAFVVGTFSPAEHGPASGGRSGGAWWSRARCECVGQRGTHPRQTGSSLATQRPSRKRHTQETGQGSRQLTRRVHRRVPPRSRRQGTGRRPCAIPCRARRRRTREQVDRRLPGAPSAGRRGTRWPTKVATLPVTDAGARTFQRFIFGAAFEVELDRQGRVVIPAGAARVRGSRDRGRGGRLTRPPGAVVSPSAGRAYSARHGRARCARRAPPGPRASSSRAPTK